MHLSNYSSYKLFWEVKEIGIRIKLCQGRDKAVNSKLTRQFLLPGKAQVAFQWSECGCASVCINTTHFTSPNLH